MIACLALLGTVAVTIPSPAEATSVGAAGVHLINSDRVFVDSWASPLGDIIVATVEAPGAVNGFLAAYAATGDEVFDLALGTNVDDVTFNAAGDLFVVTAARNNGATSEVRLLHLSATGGLLNSALLNSTATYDHGIEFGADGNLWVDTHPGANSTVVVVDPASLAVIATPITASGEIGEVQARTEGVVFLRYTGNATLIEYGPGHELTHYPPIGNFNPPSTGFELSLAPDLDLWNITLQWDSSRGTYPCDEGLIGVQRPDGSSLSLPASVAFGLSPDCELWDIEALPDGGAVVSAVEGSGVLLSWLDDSGLVTAQIEHDSNSFDNETLDSHLTDLSVDGDGTAILAVTVPSRLCPSDLYERSPCARVDLLGFDPSGALDFNTSLHGDGASTDETDDSVRLNMHGHLQFQELRIANGAVASPVDLNGFYAPHGIGATGEAVWIEALNVDRQWWHDPPEANSPPPPNVTEYIALGDSYSAGEGIEPFFEGPEQECHRSTLAYSTLVQPVGFDAPLYELRDDPSANVRWGFQACSGALTEHVLSTGGFHGDPYPQLAQDRDNDPNPHDLVVDADTDLITITIGGNDAGFADALSFCWKRQRCQDILTGTGTYRSQLEGQVENVRIAVRSVYETLRERAPEALIIVLGYPNLFPDTRREMNCTKLREHSVRTIFKTKISQGFSFSEQWMFRDLATSLNGIISEEVARIGSSRIVFVPVSNYFANHEVCGDGGEWINGPTASASFDLVNDQSFHPNTLGQQAYARCVNAVFFGTGQPCEALGT